MARKKRIGLIGDRYLDSQEVVRCAPRHMWFTPSRSGIEDQEIVVHLLVHLHYARFVATTVAVVRRGENRHHLLLVTPVVACHHELMCASHCFQPIFLNELVANILSEGVAGAAGRDTPACSVVRI